MMRLTLDPLNSLNSQYSIFKSCIKQLGYWSPSLSFQFGMEDIKYNVLEIYFSTRLRKKQKSCMKHQLPTKGIMQLHNLIPFGPKRGSVFYSFNFDFNSEK